jgi:hypothetical protein
MKYIIAILIMLACTACNVYASQDVLPDEVEWLDDPYYLESLFGEWYSDDPNIQGWHAEYEQVVIENWGKGGKQPYSWYGDLNHDGITNMIDFGKAAAEYRGRIVCPEKFQASSKSEGAASQSSSTVIATPSPTRLQIVYFLLLLSDTSGCMD